MFKIPKKISERFKKSVPKFQKVLEIAKDRDVNESDTVAILNDILGEVFGYDKYLEVTSEFAIRSTYCDLAIKIEGKTQFLIEAKAIGIELKENHIKQAIDYGANHGVQWVVLTNGLEWRVYRIRFEQPINYDLVFSFDFSSLSAGTEKDQDMLYTLSKEGLAKDVRETFYEKVQSVNRYVIGQLILSDPVTTVIRRELKKLADGMQVDVDEVCELIRKEVLKREVVEGDDADTAAKRVSKFYRKSSAPKLKKKKTDTLATPRPEVPEESISERLLRESSGGSSETPTH